MKKRSLLSLTLTLALSVVAPPAWAERSKPPIRSSIQLLKVPKCDPIDGLVKSVFRRVEGGVWASGALPDPDRVRSGESILFVDQVSWDELDGYVDQGSSGALGFARLGSWIDLILDQQGNPLTGLVRPPDDIKNWVYRRFQGRVSVDPLGRLSMVASDNTCVRGIVLRSLPIGGKDALQIEINIEEGDFSNFQARRATDRPTKPSDLGELPAVDEKRGGAGAAQDLRG